MLSAAVVRLTGCILERTSRQTTEKIHPHFPCELGSVVRQAEKRHSTAEPELVDSFPLCKETVAFCPVLRCALTASGVWKHTKGLPLQACLFAKGSISDLQMCDAKMKS